MIIMYEKRIRTTKDLAKILKLDVGLVQNKAKIFLDSLLLLGDVNITTNDDNLILLNSEQFTYLGTILILFFMDKDNRESMGNINKVWGIR